MSVTISKGYRGTGLPSLERNLDATLKNVEQLCQTGMSRWADAVMLDAVENAPIDTGNLKKSGFVVKRGTRHVKEPSFDPYGDTPSAARKLAKAYDFWNRIVGQALAEVKALKGSRTMAVIFGFPLEYAFAVHEDMGIRKGNKKNERPGYTKNYRFQLKAVATPGAKYLENAIYARMDDLPRMCADAVKARLNRTRLPKAVPVDMAKVDALLDEVGSM